MFSGGPLVDEQIEKVHSLIIHMKGDGYHTIGSYIRNENDIFVWHPNPNDVKETNG